MNASAPPAAPADPPGALASIRRGLSEPLFRNGHALVLSSFATATIGFAYWILAARGYPPALVGRSSVAITTMSFVGGIAQCNLASALVRFIPSAGRSLRRFVAGCYAMSIAISLLFGFIFIVAVPTLVPSLTFLRDNRGLAVWFVVSTAVQAVFVLEDGALTGLRRATLVPIENSAFSLLKVALVVGFAAAFPSLGIFLSWTIASIATVIPTNAYIFWRAIPAQQRERPVGSVSLRDLVRYVPYDYGAWLFWAVAVTLLPLLVINVAGAAAAATFSFAWVITYSLYLVSINLGSSLTVESAADQSDLPAQVRRVVLHLAKLLVPASAAVAVAAPYILRLFGHGYAAAGTTTLRLLAISAPPFILTATVQSALRSLRRTRVVLAIDASLCTAVVGLSWVLLPSMGIVATGIAWACSQYAVAGFLALALLARRRAARMMPDVAPAAPGLARLDATAVLGVVSVGGPPYGDAAAATPVPAALLRSERRPVRDSEEVLGEMRPAILEQLAALWPAGQLPAAQIVVAPEHGDALRHGATVLVRGCPVAVAHVARSSDAAALLNRRFEAVVALRADERLGDWRALLPDCVISSAGGRAFLLERLSGGSDARHLLAGNPWLERAVARRGLEVVTTLHARTPVAPGAAEPLESVLESAFSIVEQRIGGLRHSPDNLRSLLRLEERLGEAAAAADGEPRSWTLGALRPEELRLAFDALSVTGLSGLERARPDGICAVDVVGFLLRLLSLRDNLPLSVAVAEICGGGRLAGEVQILAAAALEHSRLSLGDLALWCWLDEAASTPTGGRGSSTPSWPSLSWPTLSWEDDVVPVLARVPERAEQ